jgi:hypothetical protein
MANQATRQANTPMVVLGLYPSRVAIDNAMKQFSAAGFLDSKISVIVPDESGARKVENLKSSASTGVSEQVDRLTAPETKDISSGRAEDVAPKNTKITQGAGTGAGIGAALGGSLGWVATLTGIAIPGLGAFLIAGPLIGILAGGAAGGAVGTLVGMGIPEDEAKLYEDRLRKGGLLVTIHADSLSEADRARNIFRHTGASDIASAPENPADNRNR